MLASKHDIVDTEVAWAAGFFDGEGTTWTRKHKKANGSMGFYPSLSISQNEVWPLERFRQAVGEGRIHLIKSRKGPFYTLGIYSTEAVLSTLNLLWPYLSPSKREQAHNALREDS